MKFFTVYRLPSTVYLLSFIAALMPFAAYQAHEVTLAFLLLACGLSFLILKHPFESGPSRWSLWLILPLMGFWGTAFISILCSQAPYVSLIYFCIFSLMPLSLLWVLFAPWREDFLVCVACGLALIFTALSAAAIVQFFFVPEGLLYGRARWPFSDPNSLAGFLAPGFFAALGLMIVATRRVHSNAGLMMAIVIMGGIFATGSRGAVLAIVPALVVFAALLWPQVKKHKKCCSIFFLAVVIVLGVMQIERPAIILQADETLKIADKFFGSLPDAEDLKGPESAGQRLEETLTGQTPLLWARPAIWRATGEIIGQHFWTGTGIGTFYLYYSEVRSPADRNSAGRMAHSDPLQFWAEMGFFAPTFFYIFIAAAVLLSFRALGKIERGDARRARIVAPLCGLGALVLHAHITFHFYVPGLLMLAGLLTGYWYIQVKEVFSRGEAEKRRLHTPDLRISAFKFSVHPEFLKFMIITPLLLLSLGFFMLQSGHIMVQQGQAHYVAGDLDGMTRRLNKAAHMSLNKDAEAHVLAANLPLNILLAMDKAAPPREAAQHFEQGNRYLDEAQRLNPRLAEIFFVRARLVKAGEAFKIKYDSTPEELLQQTLRLNPQHYNARMMLAQIYRQQGDKAKALNILYAGRPWIWAADEPVEYYRLVGAVAVESGNMEAQRWAFKMMTRYFPARESVP